MDNPESDQKRRAKTVDLIEDFNDQLQKDHQRTRFLVSIGKGRAQKLLTCQQVMDHIERDSLSEVVWKLKSIVSHQGPLKPTHPHCSGSTCSAKVEWESGEAAGEPLSKIAADDPVTCTICAKGHSLLNKPGWKRFKSIARREKKFARMAKQAMLNSCRTAPKFKHGCKVPWNCKHAVRLDGEAGNTRWQDAIRLELFQLGKHNTFTDLGHKERTKPPGGCLPVRLHFVFDIKHDGRHKARLVASGALTPVPLESVCSGVVSLGLSAGRKKRWNLGQQPLLPCPKGQNSAGNCSKTGLALLLSFSFRVPTSPLCTSDTARTAALHGDLLPRQVGEC